MTIKIIARLVKILLVRCGVLVVTVVKLPV